MSVSISRGPRIAAVALAALTLTVVAPVPHGSVAARAWQVPAAPSVSTSERIATNADYHARRTLGTGFLDATAGKTVVAWNGPGMRFDVRTFDQRAGTWDPAVTVAPAIGTLDWNSYHDYGVMVHLPDGRYGIFAADHASHLRLIKAPTPNSVAGTWSDVQINKDWNMYPVPVVAGNTVYVFYSKYMPSATGTYRTYRYIRSTYDRATSSWSAWSSPVTVIDTGETSDRFNEVYGAGAQYDPATQRIHFSWTMAGGPGGHNGQGRHLYAAYLDLADRAMHTVGGASLGSAVSTSELEAVKVFDAPPAPTTEPDYAKKHPVQNSEVTVARDGSLRVAFGDRGSNTIRIARYAAGAWSTVTVDTGAHNFLDLRRTGDTLQVLYVRSGAGSRVVLAESTDGGATWPSKRTVAVDLTRVPGATAPTGITYVNFIENGDAGTIQAAGSAIDWANPKSHNMRWPVFVLR